MQFFKRKFMYPHRWTTETPKSIDKLFKEYASHINAIQKSLPEGARVLAEVSFHDATIKEVRHLSKREVQIVIEGGYDKIEYGEYTLSFSGVRKAWVPYSIVGDTWLYAEMDLADDNGIDYQVLLVKDEIRIQASDVQLIPTVTSSANTRKRKRREGA